jgi:hypothetical protein
MYCNRSCNKPRFYCTHYYVVTFVAVVFGTNQAQKDIGVGAAIGGPLVLATIAYAVVGWTFIYGLLALSTPHEPTLMRLVERSCCLMIVGIFIAVLPFSNCLSP